MAWSSEVSNTTPAPHDLLDDGFAPDPCQLLVIGCGNILRGDDAVGPVLIRQMFVRGVPDGVRLVDGGTAGMDVAFGMRGAERVVIVDASATGVAPGTIYRVPAEELSDLPPIDGLHTHNFRWDHALSFSSWLLGPLKPADITVFLVEAGQFEPGSELSDAVAAGMNTVMDLIEAEFYPVVSTGSAGEERVEITDAGYLHIPAELAAKYFPGDVAVATMHDGELVLMPLVSASHGGLVLKQRNLAGDRTLLISEVLGFQPVRGTFEVAWDDARGALRVLLDQPDVVRLDGDARGIRGADRGGEGARPVVGVPPDHDPAGNRSTAARDDVLPRSEGAPGGRRYSTYGGTAAATTRGDVNNKGAK